jgi:hypothetical protein
MGHVEPVVTLLLNPVGVSAGGQHFILLLDQLPAIAAANPSRRRGAHLNDHLTMFDQLA